MELQHKYQQWTLELWKESQENDPKPFSYHDACKSASNECWEEHQIRIKLSSLTLGRHVREGRTIHEANRSQSGEALAHRCRGGYFEEECD